MRRSTNYLSVAKNKTEHLSPDTYDNNNNFDLENNKNYL